MTFLRGWFFCLGGAQLPSILHHLHPAVVLAQGTDHLWTEQIGTAITHPGHLVIGTDKAHGHHRTAHALAGRIQAGRCDDRLIGRLHSLLQAIALADRCGHAVDHNGTGHFATLMAAHAVGDHPQAQLRTAEYAVFIVSADQARHTAAGILHVDSLPFEDLGQSSGGAECIR